MTRPPAPSDRTTSALIVQAVERVEALSMFRLYRMIFELCWYQPSAVLSVLDSLEDREWKRTPGAVDSAGKTAEH